MQPTGAVPHPFAVWQRTRSAARSFSAPPPPPRATTDQRASDAHSHSHQGVSSLDLVWTLPGAALEKSSVDGVRHTPGVPPGERHTLLTLHSKCSPPQGPQPPRRQELQADIPQVGSFTLARYRKDGVRGAAAPAASPTRRLDRVRDRGRFHYRRNILFQPLLVLLLHLLLLSSSSSSIAKCDRPEEQEGRGGARLADGSEHPETAATRSSGPNGRRRPRIRR
jgi:hypothetical protein